MHLSFNKCDEARMYIWKCSRISGEAREREGERVRGRHSGLVLLMENRYANNSQDIVPCSLYGHQFLCSRSARYFAIRCAWILSSVIFYEHIGWIGFGYVATLLEINGAAVSATTIISDAFAVAETAATTAADPTAVDVFYCYHCVPIVNAFRVQ